MRTTNASVLGRTPIIKSHDIPAINKAKLIIENNIIDHWPLGLLASKVGINEFKLKIGFKQLYSDTPYQYLLNLRLQKAERLLTETDLLVKEIAVISGFDTYRGLSKAFKKRFGSLPLKYRKYASVTCSS